MKNTFIFIKQFKEQFCSTLLRFPETLFLSYTFGILAVWLIQAEGIGILQKEVVTRLLMLAVLGIPMTAALKLLTERFPRAYWRIAGNIATALFLLVFYFSIPTSMPFFFTSLYRPVSLQFLWQFAILFASFVLCFSLVPFFMKKEHYSLYVIKLFEDAAVTILFTLALFAGSSVILFSLNELFKANINDAWFFNIFILLTSFFASTYFFSLLIKRPEDITKYTCSNILKILFADIIIPLLAIYTAILYAYFVRLLFYGGIPENVIVNLVLWYGLVVVVMLFSSDIIEGKKPLVCWFCKWMPRLVLLPLAIMFWAMAIRIQAHGLTVNRYMVLALGVFILGNALYWIVGIKKNTSLMVAAAIAVMLFSAFGPLSASPVSIWSQNLRFNAALERMGLWQDERIIPNSELPVKDRIHLANFINHFQIEYGLAELQRLPANFDPAEDMEAVFGFLYSPLKTEYGILVPDYFNLSAAALGSIREIGDYESFYLIMWSEGDPTFYSDPVAVDVLPSGNIILRRERHEELELPFGAWVYEMRAESGEIGSLTDEQAWIEKQVNGESIILRIQNASGIVDLDGNLTFYHIHVLLFMK